MNLMMQLFYNPDPSEWKKLAERPTEASSDISGLVEGILDRVRVAGDAALLELTQKFDGVKLTNLRVTDAEIEEASAALDPGLKLAIGLARDNIYSFHFSQKVQETPVETMSGVTCWRQSRPIDKIGLYVPGGTAPLFSTVLMLAIPAGIAGCKDIIMCTPPAKDGSIHPATLYAAQLSGVTQIYKVGGAQAIAALAFGTESITAVQKIFGPGNQFVTEAKIKAQQTGIAIDMPAGPSEVLVIADQSAHPDFIAADLISQAEHGIDSQVVFLSSDRSLLDKVRSSIEDQLEDIPRAEIAREALGHSIMIYFDDLEDALSFSNVYAPEHLILSVMDPHQYLDKVINAGSVFIGHYSPESVGDYASGTNHTLPTNGYARAYSGVSLDSFIKKITFQELTTSGLKNIGPAVEILAEAESLIGHKNAVSIRLKTLNA